MLKLFRLFQLGTRLYNCRRWINYRCVFVFLVRVMMHQKKSEKLLNFFRQTALRNEIFQMYPLFFSQLTRQFFYKNSTTAERLNIIQQNFSFWEETVTMPTLRKLYLHSELILWSEPYQNSILSLELGFRKSEAREGMMTLTLRNDRKSIYHLNFWISNESNNRKAIYIGAIQGSRNGLAINKELTKHFFGCRPKNLLLFTLRSIAANLHIVKIYGVSDYGFYANNHFLRCDRKLKTSLTSFWREVGAMPCSDPRFFSLPVAEKRKEVAIIAPSKRNLYRKRFASLDKISAEITCAFDLVKHSWLKTG